MMTQSPIATASVCQTCYEYAHGYDVTGTGPYPAMRLLQGVDITPGCLDCDPCGHDDCSNGATLCDCGHGDGGHGFSWSRCDGCGSLLGGDRFPLVVWGDVPE
jgi:hypothetical protein